MNKLVCLLSLLFLACNSEPVIVPNINNNLRVYPNPFIDVAYIDFDNPSQREFTVVVVGTDGEVLFKEIDNITNPNYNVNFSGEPEGTYHVIVDIDGTTITRRIFKKSS